jgi:hypothetical protein
MSYLQIDASFVVALLLVCIYATGRFNPTRAAAGAIGIGALLAKLVTPAAFRSSTS